MVDMKEKLRAALDKFTNDLSAALKTPFLAARLQRKHFALHFSEKAVGSYGASAQTALSLRGSSIKKRMKE